MSVAVTSKGGWLLGALCIKKTPTTATLKSNRSRGTTGDLINALLSAAAMNFGKLLSFFLALWLDLLEWLFPENNKPRTA